MHRAEQGKRQKFQFAVHHTMPGILTPTPAGREFTSPPRIIPRNGSVSRRVVMSVHAWPPVQVVGISPAGRELVRSPVRQTGRAGRPPSWGAGVATARDAAEATMSAFANVFIIVDWVCKSEMLWKKD